MTIHSRGFPASRLLPALSILLAWTPLAAAVPPAETTYFAVILGFDAPYSWVADCLTFTDSEFCTSDGECGTWVRTEAAGRESGLTFDLTFDDNGQEVRIDARGEESSLALAASVEAGGSRSNIGIAGRSAGKKQCRRILRDFMNDVPMKNPSCYSRAEFGDPEESDYILPFPEGTGYRLITSYCTRGGHPNSIAYDFAIPVGADIVAARAGTVVMVWEETPDEPDEIRPNGFFIEHDDGTVGSYAHITYQGVLVEEGDRVEAGQVIAIAGTSGTSEPHLHFMVYQEYPDRVEDDDVPVNFRNAEGPLDERGGLMWGYVYTAEPE